jgi:hypothetical protein
MPNLQGRASQAKTSGFRLVMTLSNIIQRFDIDIDDTLLQLMAEIIDKKHPLVLPVAHPRAPCSLLPTLL